MAATAQLIRQKGVALLLFLFIVVVGATTTFLFAWNNNQGKRKQDRQTELAMQQAKEALIAYAVSFRLSGSKRPGDLPCPDLNNDGIKETSSCGNPSGSTYQSARLGRLPWKDLDLPDLRDGSGERLWYAVSNNFKENARHFPLNSDTTGTISVADANGNVTPNVIAVVIAPGEPLQRLDATAPQDRSAGNENTPAQYLDKTSAEDNADFQDGTTNGFVSGVVRDAMGNILVNDKALVITNSDLAQALIRRALAEIRGIDTVGGLLRFHWETGYFPWADTDANGQGNVGQTIGALPYAELVFDGTTANWLNSNGWFPLVSYQRLSADSVQISIGSTSLRVVP